MRDEPAVIGQVVALVGTFGAVFWPPVNEAIAAAGGQAAVVGAVAVIHALVGFFVRSKVTPVG